MEPIRHYSTEHTPSTARIESFSDGVLSIIITLLVFQIDLPARTSLVAFSTFIKLLPTLLAFALSFFIIATFWIRHHQFFHILKTSDRKLLWLNINFLFWTALIPFTSSMMGQHLFEKVPMFFYGVVLFLTSLSFYLLRLYVKNNPKLLHEEVVEYKTRMELRKSMLIFTFFGIGAITSFISPLLAGIIYSFTTIFSVIRLSSQSFIFSNIKNTV